MTSPFVLEACVESAPAARRAAAHGADRVELCRELDLGGTSPSPEAIREACGELPIPVVVLVRPRAGDFVYGRGELDAALATIGHARAAGAAGVALGCLTPDGGVDVEATAELVAAARPLAVTFHRAFDAVHEPEAELERLVELRVDRLLTSGGRPRAVDGVDVLAALVRRAGARLAVVVGGGVRPTNVAALVRATGARELHFRVDAGDAERVERVRAEIPDGG